MYNNLLSNEDLKFSQIKQILLSTQTITIINKALIVSNMKKDELLSVLTIYMT